MAPPLLTGCDIPFTCLPILITTDGHYVGVLSLCLYQKLQRGRRRRLVNTTSSHVMMEAVSMTDSDVTDVLTVLTALTNSSVVCMSRSITSHDAGLDHVDLSVRIGYTIFTLSPGHCV